MGLMEVRREMDEKGIVDRLKEREVFRVRRREFVRVRKLEMEEMRLPNDVHVLGDDDNDNVWELYRLKITLLYRWNLKEMVEARGA